MVNCFLMLTPYSAVMMMTSPISSTISSSSVISMFLPTDLSSTIYISPTALSFHQHSLYWVMAMWLFGNSMHYTYTAISNGFFIGQHNDVPNPILLLLSELDYYPRLIYFASHFYVADFL